MVCKNTILALTGDDYHTIDKVRNLLLNNKYAIERKFLIVSEKKLKFPKAIFPLIDGHNPAGGSVKTAVHFAQIYDTGKASLQSGYYSMQRQNFCVWFKGRQTFQPYDFGSSGNLLAYNQTSPPPYDLSKVKAPVYIFWGRNDKVLNS